MITLGFLRSGWFDQALLDRDDKWGGQQHGALLEQLSHLQLLAYQMTHRSRHHV